MESSQTLGAKVLFHVPPVRVHFGQLIQVVGRRNAVVHKHSRHPLGHFRSWFFERGRVEIGHECKNRAFELSLPMRTGGLGRTVGLGSVRAAFSSRGFDRGLKHTMKIRTYPKALTATYPIHYSVGLRGMDDTYVCNVTSLDTTRG